MATASGEGARAVRDAATVVLVRDSAAGVEVFVQRRVRQMAFAAGMTVFPGGGVEERDFEDDLPWQGPPLGVWADAFGVDPGRARAAVCAAVRETFEECGVLLAGAAGPGGAGLGGAVPTAAELAQPELVRARGELAAGRLSLARFLRGQGWALRADLVRPLANWVTPVGEGRRYDTRFFLARLPDGQEADAATSEAAEAGWRPVGQVLLGWRGGADILLPPTWAQLRWLATHAGAAAALEAAAGLAPVTPVMPVLTRHGDQARIEFDGCGAYYADGPGHPWAGRPGRGPAAG